MTISTDTARAPMLGPLRSGRPVQEVAVAAFFGPLANGLVRVLARTPITPPSVVLAHGFVGLVAAVALGLEGLVFAAVLLQVKTLLDNADGRLARATGRVSLAGRYLDTVVDLMVNAALFVALAVVTDEIALAALAFVALTLVLAADFNVSRLYAETVGTAPPDPPAMGSGPERLLGAVYRAGFEPQDRALRALVQGRLRRALDGEHDPGRIERATLAYHDRATVTVLANLGLSTQLVVLGACLVAGAPVVYLWLVPCTLALLPVLQARRELIARRALRA